jgi:hypothetical protein
LGVSRTVTTSPSADIAQGLPAGIGLSQEVHQVADDNLLNEPDDHNQNKKGHVEAADIRNVTPYRFQHWLGDPVKDVTNDGHHWITGINHVEHYQPAQDCCYQQHEKIEVQKFVDEQQ